MFNAGMRQYGPLTQKPTKRRENRKEVPLCSQPYDDDHIRLHGYDCMNRHSVYNWPSLNQEKYLLIGDSLIKYINRCKHLRVVSLPGARAYDVFNRLMRRQIRLEHYNMIFCAIGTNDVACPDTSATLVAESIMTLMWVIRKSNPTAILVVLGMLIRPCDLGKPTEYKRRVVNSLVQSRCRAQGIYFRKAWKCLMTRSQVRVGVYARDNLHLNRIGARRVYQYVEGNIINLEGIMRL